MEFFIKKGATLPLLKLNIVDNGRNDYNNFLNTLELSSLFFSMTNFDTGIPKITNKPAGVGGEYPNYFIYYQFQNTDTIKEGRFEGEFIIKNDYGTNILTLGEKLYVNITESFILEDLEYVSCYVVDYPCCFNPLPVPLPQPSSTPTPTPTVTDSQLTLTLQGIINPGSVVIDYVLTSNRIFSQELTMSFSNSLGVIVGSPILITTGVTLPVGEFTGTTQVILPDDFQNLSRESLFFGNSINLTGLTYTTYYQNSVFYATPTPTPTPTPTETIICECFEIVAPLAVGSYSYIDCSGVEQPVIELGIGEISRVCVGNSKINAFDGAEFYVVGLCSDCLLPTPTPTPTQTSSEILLPNIIEEVNSNSTFTTNKEALSQIIEEKPEKLIIELPFKDGFVNVNLTRRKVYEDNFRIRNEFGEILYSELGEHYEGIVEGKQNSVVSLSITTEGFSGNISDDGLNIDINNISGQTHHCSEVSNEDSHECNVINDDEFELNNNTDPQQELNNNLDEISFSNIEFSNLNSYVTVTANKNVRYVLECDYDIYTFFSNDLQAVINYMTALFNSWSAIFAAEGVSITLSEIIVWTTGDSPYRTYGYKTSYTPSGLPIPCTADTNNTNCALYNYRAYYYDNSLTINGDASILLTACWPRPCTSNARTSTAYVGQLCSTTYANVIAHQLRPTTVSPGSPPPEGFVDSGNSNLSIYYGFENGWNVVAGAHEIGHMHSCYHTFSKNWNCNYTIGDSNTYGSCCLDQCGCGINCATCGGTSLQNPTGLTCITSASTIMSYNSRQCVFGPQPQRRMVNYINGLFCLQGLDIPTPTQTKTPTPTPTRTKTPTPTLSPFLSPNPTNSNTPTPTPTLSPFLSPNPTRTKTPTPTPTPTRTKTPTPTRTSTPTKSINISSTLTPTPTRTKTPTPTKSTNITSNLTPTPTRTKTPTPTRTLTPTPTRTLTPTKSSNISLTKTPTPTRTKTPTPSTSISVSLCDILSVANSTGIIYKYDYVSNIVTELPVNGRQVLPSDIAVSENYLFTISANTIRRFQITRNPWSAINPTDFVFPTGTFATSNNGLFALNDSTLISFNTLNQIVSVNLTSLTTSILFSLPAGRSIAGDIIYTTNNRYIIVNRSISTSTTFVSQFDSLGNPMGEMSMASVILVNGSLFVYNSELYIQRQSTPPHNYKLTFPSTISPVLSTSTITSLGFAQLQSCINYSFPVS